ncbi:MAG TPA: Ger(x)C family spore germination protein [Symbiobacteriaceae bacterium]|nr:Ger(x)C family spore germination protein [Symbiobacteriaceae bacterium]
MNGSRGVALLLCLMLLSGCWNRREVNEVAIVSALAIDRDADSRLRVTLQVANPLPASGERGDTGSREGVFTISATGRTLFEAIRNLNQMVSRKPEWTHNNAIIIGEQVARDGVGHVLDFFLRDHESRLDQWILVARGKAADVLVPSFRLEMNQGVGIRRLNRNAFLETAKTTQVRLYEFLLRLSSPPTAPMAAAVEPLSESAGQLTAPEPESRLRIGGAAVFRGAKMVGWLDEHQTRGVAWLHEKLSSTIVVVPCKKPPGEGISVEVMGARSTLRPVWQGGRLPVVHAPVTVSAKIGDVMCPDDFTKPAAIHELENRAAGVIRQEIAQTLRHLQQDLGVDPAGIGASLQRAFPEAWRAWKGRWDEIYPLVPVVPEVTVRLDQTGTAIGKPFRSGRDQ